MTQRWFESSCPKTTIGELARAVPEKNVGVISIPAGITKGEKSK
jgi:hypothetical protein